MNLAPAALPRAPMSMPTTTVNLKATMQTDINTAGAGSMDDVLNDGTFDI